MMLVDFGEGCCYKLDIPRMKAIGRELDSACGLVVNYQEGVLEDESNKWNYVFINDVHIYNKTLV